MASYVEEVPRRILYGLVVAVRPNLDFPADQLVVLASNDGFAETLGRSNAIDRAACTIVVETPLPRLEATAVMHLGDVHLDPDTYEDHRPKHSPVAGLKNKP